MSLPRIAGRAANASRLTQPRGLKSVPVPGNRFYNPVEAYAASWIEIIFPVVLPVYPLSRLTQPRGLKL